ncbi:NUDIX hydrolase, partial [Candidatus Falkowbacteria bacterium]|nr:NUDIX hydrolase [Candidatus Falkowbacteria bacterium]
MATNYKKYEHAVIATDIVVLAIIKQQLNVLLIQMNKEPYKGMWAAPGGIVRGNESLDDAANRVLLEKAGIDNVYQEQLSAFGEVDRDPFGRVVSVAYLGLIAHIPTTTTTAEHKNIEWYPIKNLPALAYDHSAIIKSAVLRLK